MKAVPSLKSKYSPETKERACYKTAFIIVIYKGKQCNEKCEFRRQVGVLRNAKTRRRWRAEFRMPKTETGSRKFPRKYANFLHYQSWTDQTLKLQVCCVCCILPVQLVKFFEDTTAQPPPPCQFNQT